MQASRELSQKIDEESIDEAEIFEIKIPLTLPYPLQSSGFERHNGRFEYKGEYYEMVKQKYESDVLTIVCVKDSVSKELENVIDSISETTTGHKQPNGSFNFSVKPIQEYIINGTSSLPYNNHCVQEIQHTPYCNSFIEISLSITSPPPKA